MLETKTFDPDEFLFDLYAMSSTEVEKIFLKEIDKVKPNVEKLKVMADSGLVDVNAKNYDGDAPLHWASERNYIEIAKLLIDAGADVEAKNEYDMTPLHLATWKNHIEIAKLLIEAGADLEAKDNCGETPLHFASSNDSISIEIAKLLIEKGADVEVKSDSWGFTPLHYASRDNHIEAAKLLIDKGADVGAKNEDGITPLDLASEYGNIEAENLLQKYIKYNIWKSAKHYLSLYKLTD